MSGTYKAVEKEQQFLRDAQIVRQQYSYPLNVAVLNNSQRKGEIVIDQDADFYAEEITGKVLAPTNANGVQLTSEPTDFPAIGTLIGWAQSGLQVEIRDGKGYELTDGPINVENILTPGYGLEFKIPLKWSYYLRRNAKLVFSFTNRDTAAPVEASQLFHTAYIAIHGKKYFGETK
jgi:hypothetical protein